MTSTFNQSGYDLGDPGGWDNGVPGSGDIASISARPSGGSVSCQDIAINDDFVSQGTYVAAGTFTVNQDGFAATGAAANVVISSVSGLNATLTAGSSWTIPAGITLLGIFTGVPLTLNANIVGSSGQTAQFNCDLNWDSTSTLATGSIFACSGTLTFASGSTFDTTFNNGLFITGPTIATASGITFSGNPNFEGLFTGMDNTFTDTPGFQGGVTYTSSGSMTWAFAVSGGSSTFFGPIAVAVTVGGSSVSFVDGAFPLTGQSIPVYLSNTTVTQGIGLASQIYTAGLVLLSGEQSGDNQGNMSLEGSTINVLSGTCVIVNSVGSGVTIDGGTNFVVTPGAKGYAFGVTIPGSSSLSGGSPRITRLVTGGAL